MEQMLDLRDSKCYKIGSKNLVTHDNDFEMATGNANDISQQMSAAIVGYRRKAPISQNKCTRMY